jgi:hypothetical protein
MVEPREEATMGKRFEYVTALLALGADGWESYLATRSGLPGPRGNLELLHAVADVAAPGQLRSWAAGTDEYLAACGAAGLGRLVAEGDPDAVGELTVLAADDRWRVREGVAMALQLIGDAVPARMREIAETWAGGAPLVQRAAIAGLCEPRLLSTEADAQFAVTILDRVTGSLASLPSARRRDADVRTLRQALGYCWSVAVVAAPGAGFPALERLATTGDDDVRWVVRENLKKTRLTRADPEGAARLLALLKTAT